MKYENQSRTKYKYVNENPTTKVKTVIHVYKTTQLLRYTYRILALSPCPSGGKSDS